MADNATPDVATAVAELGKVRDRARNVTVRQVERWYGLLCDVGIDAAVTDLLSQPSGMVQKADGTTVEMVPEVDVFKHVDMGRVVQRIAREGLLTEMISIMRNIPLEEAQETAMGAFMDDLVPFIAACRMPIQALIGSVQNMA